MENIVFIVAICAMVIVGGFAAWIILRIHAIEMAKIEGRKTRVKFVIDKLIKQLFMSKAYH